MDQKEYIEYISKLIDRDLQRKQASGFTIWAILSVLAYLVFDLIDKMPDILEWPHFKFYPFLAIVLIIDFILFAIIFIFASFTYSNKRERRKLQTDLNSTKKLNYYIGLLFLVLAVMNYEAVFVLKELNIFRLPFHLWWLLFGFNGLMPYGKYISDEFKKYRFKREILNFNSQPSILKRYQSVLNLIISLFSIIFLAIYILTINFPQEINGTIVKIGIEWFALFVISIYLMVQLIEVKRNNWLVNLEQNIYKWI